MPKTPTEKITFSDAWNGFKSDYLPFVGWLYDSESDLTFVLVEFIEDNPTTYTNKWNREQYKIKVRQDEVERMLSAGKRLFNHLRDFCVKENRLPVTLGVVQIDRFGTGFDTDYKISYPKPK